MTRSQVKAAVRARDGNKCADCGFTNDENLFLYGKALDVHRLVPGSPYTVDGCVAVCHRCHGRRHRKPKSNKVRLVIAVGETIRDALRLEAAMSGSDISPVAEAVLRNGLQGAIHEIRSFKAAKQLK
jgi:hypothetical protein